MEDSDKLPLLVAIGFFVLMGILIYVFILPILCRMFTAAPTFC